MGLWEPIVGFGLYRSYFNAIGVGIFSAGLIALATHLGRGEKGWAAVGGVVTLLGLGILFPLISNTVNPQPRSAPIHDITTDTTNPPAFEVLDDTRAGANNTLEYGGAEVADRSNPPSVRGHRAHVSLLFRRRYCRCSYPCREREPRGHARRFTGGAQ